MRISRLSIENFRGIKRLDWTLPADQRLITLIGPGDSGKSTILESIHLGQVPGSGVAADPSRALFRRVVLLG